MMGAFQRTTMWRAAPVPPAVAPSGGQCQRPGCCKPVAGAARFCSMECNEAGAEGWPLTAHAAPPCAPVRGDNEYGVLAGQPFAAHAAPPCAPVREDDEYGVLTRPTMWRAAQSPGGEFTHDPEWPRFDASGTSVGQYGEGGVLVGHGTRMSVNVGDVVRIVWPEKKAHGEVGTVVFIKGATCQISGGKISPLFKFPIDRLAVVSEDDPTDSPKQLHSAL